MTAEILWNSSMILRLNGRQGQGQGKRSLEARADAFSRLKICQQLSTCLICIEFLLQVFI